MEIKVKAVAGTLESSDMYVIIEPNATGIELEIESVVMGQYGDDVRRVILESLKELGVTSAKILVTDKGAIEPVIKSRIQTVVTIVVTLIIPSSIPLVGMLMFGNLAKECGLVPNLVEHIKGALMYIITIFIGLTVGATTNAEAFLNLATIKIIILGLFAFSFGTAGGVIFGKVMCKFSKGTLNPMIGAAGVSAVPMAARVVQKVGQEENPSNFLLMHAMGPNVAGVIGSAVAAGVLLAMFK